jgi:hypothetical protein
MAPTSRGSSVTKPAQVREGSAAPPWPIQSDGEVSKPTKAIGSGVWVTRNHWLASASWSSGRRTQRTSGTSVRQRASQVNFSERSGWPSSSPAS